MPESEIAEKDGRLSVSVEYIEWLEAERRKINSIDLANIDFYHESGEKLDIPEKVIKRFKFVGLSNFCFITSGFYAEEHDDDFWKGIVE